MPTSIEDRLQLLNVRGIAILSINTLVLETKQLHGCYALHDNVRYGDFISPE